MSGAHPSSQPGILIVDDTPANLQLLAGLLRDRGYKPRPVLSGKLALQTAAAEPPDLVLLDVDMPEMDGYAVCGLFKSDPRLKDIPIIFISALTGSLDKLRAFRAGAVDYVTKPFDAEEVGARVQTHLTLRRLQTDLQHRYEELQELQQLRDGLLHMIVHDLRSPLSSVMGYLDLLRTETDALAADRAKFIEDAYGGASEMAEMISSLLDINRLEAMEMPVDRQRVDLCEVVAEAVRSLGGLSVGRLLSMAAPHGEMPVDCDPVLIRRVIGNLLGNALKFTPESGAIVVTVSRVDGWPSVAVADTGPGIPADFVGRVFDKFSQAGDGRARKRHSTGLGLTFCKLAVEAHGGMIGVSSVVGAGSRFWFRLSPEPPA
jgi:two-component system sensor histidine kinase/response regulator